MKRNLLLFFAWLIFSAFLNAQQISVESFRMLPNDMDARVTHPKTDQNGDVAALIKVVTNETGFYWEAGMLGIVTTEQKVAEIWVYVPRGSQRITIKHPQLGMLRNYAYPIPIEAATVYEMRLVTGRVETTVIPAELESQWLLITAEPNTALIYLDNNFEATGILQKRLLPGTYTYRIQNSLYHTEAGSITVTSDERAELKVTLRPNFGYIEVKSTPETGARVMIDSEDAGFTTNGTSQRLKSGEYTITVIKEQFQTASRRVSVADNQTTTVTLDMAPNFANVEVNLPADATLYINNNQKGRGNWSGRLSAGVYTFEARKDKHRPAKQDLQLQVGDKRTITLEPQPITGSLDVVSMPPQATIKINGKDYGTTPNTLRNLLIGEYTIVLEKEGYAAVTKNITVSEGGSTLINETLPSGRQISITSRPAGAELYIDNQKAGTTPYSGQLSFGSHTIKLINNTKTIEETITVAQTGTTSFSFDVSETNDYTETTAALNLEMVFVKGGTFTMGCTSEQSDCGSDEKPTHQVTVSDFYMGKYEVTNAQFCKFLNEKGNQTEGGVEWINLSGKYDDEKCRIYKSGSSFYVESGYDNYPVIYVSWYGAKAFCDWISTKTGKNYKLPTEAQWEFAARSRGKSVKYAWGNGAPTRNNGGNIADEAAKRKYSSWTIWDGYDDGYIYTAPVGSFGTNELGLADMSGNVWEWCSDWYGSDYYKNSPQNNPQGPASGSDRVIRGGSCGDSPRLCRVADRYSVTPDARNGNVGFRLSRMD